MAHHITVYGSSWCSDCKRAKRFLGDQQVQYKRVDIEQDAEGRALVEKVNDGKDIIPTEGAATALTVRHYLETIGEAGHVEVEMMGATAA